MATQRWENELQTAVRAAKAAGKIIRDRRRSLGRIDVKARSNFVTDVDLACEEKIVRILKKKFPAYGIHAEERGEQETADSPFCWYIDPLDGTNNYIHGFPMCAVSIGLTYRKMPVVGVTYNPLLDLLFEGTERRQTLFNGDPVSVSGAKYRDVLGVTGFYYERGGLMDANLRIIRRVLTECQDVRRTGSAAMDLAWVAAGRIDVYWEIGIQPWDVCAGLRLVRSAGGYAAYGICRFDGKELPFCLAANPKTAPRFRKLLSSEFDLTSKRIFR